MAWSGTLGTKLYPGIFGGALAAGFPTKSSSFSFLPLVMLSVASLTPGKAFQVGLAFGLARTGMEIAVILRSEKIKRMPIVVWSAWWPRLQVLRGLEAVLVVVAAIGVTTAV